MTSRRNRPSTRWPRSSSAAGRVDLNRVVAEVGQLEVAQQQAAVGVRVGAHPPRRPAAPARAVGAQRARSRRRAPRAGSCASTARAARGARGCADLGAAAPGGRGRCPPPAGRRPPSGPVQPFGVRSTIIGHGGRSGRGPSPRRGRAGSRRSRRATSSSVAGQLLVHRRRVVAGRRSAARSRSRAAARASSARGMRASTVGLAIL